MTTSGITVVRGEQELYPWLTHAFAHACTEISCAVDQLFSWVITRTSSVPATSFPPGVRVRKLYRAGLLLDPAFAGYAHTMADLGAEVRVPEREVNETVLIDRRIAVLAGATAYGPRGYSVVTVPEVVQGIASLFDTAWATAAPLELWDADRSDLRALAPRVLEALAAGAKDETAARTVGLSVRTYRRRVAELMAALGAETRFQAGVRARELGLI